MFGSFTIQFHLEFEGFRPITFGILVGFNALTLHKMFQDFYWFYFFQVTDQDQSALQIKLGFMSLYCMGDYLNI